MKLEDNGIKEMAFFNHLDFVVKVHPTEFTAQSITRDQRSNLKVNTQVMGQKIKLELPPDSFRIVGFEVIPRSVPYGKACTPEAYEPGYETIWPDQQYQFSYNVRYELSEDKWPSRYDHYVKT
jgi:hypothetical protein